MMMMMMMLMLLGCDIIRVCARRQSRQHRRLYMGSLLRSMGIIIDPLIGIPP